MGILGFEETIENKSEYLRDVFRMDTHSDVFRFFLSVAGYAEQNGIDNYAFIGEHATLAHLVGQFGKEIIPVWKGADDVDIAAQNFELMGLLYNCGYEHCEFTKSKPKKDFEDPSKMSGRIVDIIEVRGKVSAPIFSVDYWTPNRGNIFIRGVELSPDFFSKIEHVDVYGVNVPVPYISKLMLLRLTGGEPRPQDKQDLVDLVSVLAARKKNPGDLLKELGVDASAGLYKVMQDYISGINDINKPHIVPTIVRVKSDNGLILTERFSRSYIERYERSIKGKDLNISGDDQVKGDDHDKKTRKGKQRKTSKQRRANRLPQRRSFHSG